jgi:acyl carrier protein
MNVQDQLKVLLNDVLHLEGRIASWNQDMPLLGSLPELDSLAIVGVVSAIEQTFGFAIEDDEISADTLATLQSLTQFIERKQATSQ